MTEITRILNQIEDGDPSAGERLIPLIYEELRKLAAAKVAMEQPGQTVQATSLVHDAYIRLVDVEQAQHWDSRGHFFSAAAEAMRRILIENARRKKRIKHGGERQRQELLDVPFRSGIPVNDLLDLDDAIAKFQLEEPEKAEVVRLRFFAGLNHEQVGEVLGVSAITARRHWRYARAWLRREMGRDPGE